MIVLKYPKLLFLFNRDDENVSKCSVLSNWLRKSLGNGKINATIKMVQPKFSPGLGEIDGKMISAWNLGFTCSIQPNNSALITCPTAASVMGDSRT